MILTGKGLTDSNSNRNTRTRSRSRASRRGARGGTVRRFRRFQKKRSGAWRSLARHVHRSCQPQLTCSREFRSDSDAGLCEANLLPPRGQAQAPAKTPEGREARSRHNTHGDGSIAMRANGDHLDVWILLFRLPTRLGISSGACVQIACRSATTRAKQVLMRERSNAPVSTFAC